MQQANQACCDWQYSIATTTNRRLRIPSIINNFKERVPCNQIQQSKLFFREQWSAENRAPEADVYAPNFKMSNDDFIIFKFLIVLN